MVIGIGSRFFSFRRARSAVAALFRHSADLGGGGQRLPPFHVVQEQEQHITQIEKLIGGYPEKVLKEAATSTPPTPPGGKQ